MFIINNLLSLLEKKGLKQADLCEAIGISSSTMTNWKNRGTDPPAKHIIPICEFLDISPYLLLVGVESSSSADNLSADERELLDIYNALSPMGRGQVKERAIVLSELEVSANAPKPESRTIPYSVLKVSAGSGEYLDADQMEPIRIVSNDRTADADFAVKITGDSMEPQYSDGDIVLVKSQPAVELGQIGIFIIDGHGYIKQLGERELISLNPDYENIPLHEYQETECKGLVLGVLEPSDILS